MFDRFRKKRGYSEKREIRAAHELVIKGIDFTKKVDMRKP